MEVLIDIISQFKAERNNMEKPGFDWFGFGLCFTPTPTEARFFIDNLCSRIVRKTRNLSPFQLF
jgi:hypothetical protein